MEDLMNDINSTTPSQSAATPAKTVSTYDTAWDDTPAPKFTSTAESYASYSAESSSVVVEAVKGLLGAMVGSIPGVLLWIIIGKIGFVAVICGAILAAGVVAGYTFMTKDGVLPQMWGIVICLAVVVIAVYFSERVVWSWELAEQFSRYMGDTRREAYMLGESAGMTESQVDTIIDSSLLETYGFTKGTFGDCFSNFHKAMSALGLNGRYFLNLVIAYLCAAAGGMWLFKKAAK